MTGAELASATITWTVSGGIAGQPASLPANWSITGGWLIGPGSDYLEDADLAGLNLTGADLASATLTGANLSGTNLTNSNLSGAQADSATVSGTIFAGAELNELATSGLVGKPATLPANWTLAGGFLIGPGAYLTDQNLSGLDLSGTDLASAELADANLTGANLSGTDLLAATLKGVTSGGTDLDGATVTGATWTSAQWYDTVCPDGTNSNLYLAGCFSALDTTAPVAAPTLSFGTAGANGWYTSGVEVMWNWTDNGTINSNACTQWTDGDSNGDPATLTATCTDRAGNVGHASYPVKIDMTRPVVAVTGVKSGGVYALGKVPASGCSTTESVSGVATPAYRSTTAAGSHGVGKVTATCSGAVSVAGLDQAKTVAASYTVAYGFDSFSTPHAGATVAKSARTLTVRLRLAGSSGKALSSSIARKLSASRDVRVSLSGPDITTVRDRCSWQAAARDFSCVLTIPAGVRTGTRRRYVITAGEDVGTGFVAVPTRLKASSAEVFHFR